MLCSRLLVESTSASTGACTRLRARVRCGRPMSIARTLAWVLRHRRLTMRSSSAPDRRQRRLLFVVMPKGFLPADDTGPDLRLHRGRAGHLLRGDGRASSGSSPRSSGRIRTSTGSMSSIGAGGPAQSPTRAASSSALTPRRDRPSADDGHPGAARPLLAAFPASAPTCRTSRRSASAARSDQEPLPVHPAGRRHDGALRVGAEGRGRSWRTLPGLVDVTSDLQIDYPQVRSRSTATRPPRSASRRTQIESALYRRLRISARSRRSTRRRTSTAVIMELRAASSRRTRRRWLTLYVRVEHRRAGAAEASPRVTPTDRPADDQPPGPAAGGDDLVRPQAAASRWATPIAEISAQRRRLRCRRRSPASFQGTAQAFQSSLQRPRADPAHRWRSSSSTSCWAFSTRASSTRSRFSPACRRPGSARSRRCCSSTSS